MAGHDYIETARDLLKDRVIKKGIKDLSFCLLLVTGLELVFKSFLLFYEPQANDDYLKKLGHNYKEAYGKCIKIDKAIFSDKILNNEILDFYKNFPDSVQCRFSLGLIGIQIKLSLFTILEDKLLRPLERKYFNDFGYSLTGLQPL